jgi:hypothetical protein
MDINLLSEFKLPITYIEDNISLNDEIISTIELTSLNSNNDINVGENIDEDANYNSVYGTIFNTHTHSGHQMVEEMSKYYTTDISYLKNTQRILEKGRIPTYTNDANDTCYELWKKMKGETSFDAKYGFIHWEILKVANNNPVIMQFLCINDLISPFLTIAVPILAIIIPYFILLLIGGTKLSFVESLIESMRTTSLGKLLFLSNLLSTGEKIWCLISVVLFVVTSVQGILGAKRTIKNFQEIQAQMRHFRLHIDETISSMEKHCCIIDNVGAKNTTHRGFYNEMCVRLIALKKIKQELEEYNMCLFSTNFWSFHMASTMGKLMATFYKMYNDKEYHDAMLYSFGYNAYTANLKELQTKIKHGEINRATFSKKISPELKIKSATHPLTINSTANNLSLQRGVSIITGPNASGKTTVLKTILINTLLAQQYGFGYFDELQITPYKRLHCYLNIPDTSGRDSLFQAEARRCKTILEDISNNENETHLAIFDELFSGTNPKEAEKCATETLKYMTKKKNMTAILTTHYLDMCSKLNKIERINNYHMGATYDLSKGVSTTNGGCKVLHQLQFPPEILSKLSNGC